MRKPVRRHLRPVRDVAPPSLQFRTIHGYRRAFRVRRVRTRDLLYIHGVGDNSTTWESRARANSRNGSPSSHRTCSATASPTNRAPTIRWLPSQTACATCSPCSVSTGSPSSGIRFGGGIAMQFAYQYPHLVERIVLVSSGGITKDVSLALRLAALPMGSEALAGAARAGRATRVATRRSPRREDTGFQQVRARRARRPAAVVEGLAEAGGALSAFSRTLRSVVDERGPVRHHAGSQLPHEMRFRCN